MVIVKNGKLHKDGKPYVPCIGDSLSIEAHQNSLKARGIEIDITGGKHGWFYHILMAFNCPYCGMRHSVKTVTRNQSDSKNEAYRKLFPARCECGAVYERKAGSNQARQANG